MKKRGENARAGPLAIMRQFGEPISAHEVFDHLRHGNPPPQSASDCALAAPAERAGVRRFVALGTFVVWKCVSRTDASILSNFGDRGKVEDSVLPHFLKEPSSIADTSRFAPTRQVIHGQRTSGASAEAPA